MSSICYKNFFGRKVIFKCCGSCIKPKYERRNFNISLYKDTYNSDIDLFKDNDFLNFIKNNREVNYITCMVKTDNREKDLKYLKTYKNSDCNVVEFNKYFIIYRTLTNKDIIYYIGNNQYSLKANCMYW